MTTPEYFISNEDKLGVINSHIRSIELNKYTHEIILIEQNALGNRDQNAIDRANSQIADADAQLTALIDQKKAIESE